MQSQTKPIQVWGQEGPNPAEVAIMLRELGLPYELTPIDFSEVKQPEYLAINPNGRLPAIKDPNTGITLWESGAIVEYLVERYDTEHRLSFPPGTPEYYHAKQWLFFQTTGQGPYFGQAGWFRKYHPEHVPSALERYIKEVHRVSGVLEVYLAQQEQEHGDSTGGDGPWLVGNKLSYADIAFIPWQIIMGMSFGKDDYDEDKFPHVKAWLSKMKARESVKAVFDKAQH